MYRLDEVCNLIKGTTGIQKCKPGNYPLVVTAEERLSSEDYQFDCEAVCIPLVSSTGHGHASMKRVHYQKGKFALGNILCAVIPKDNSFLLAEYLYVYFSIFKDDVLVPLMKGAANVSLTVNSLKTVEIPIPDISKQKEIISKYNIIVTSLGKIQEKNNDMTYLTDKLGETILTLAIKGKLYNDMEDNSVNNYNFSNEIPESEDIFEIPSNWKWTTLDKISEINGGYAFKSEKLKKDGVRVIRISDFDNIGFVDKKIVRTKYDTVLDPFKICNGNMLIAMTGGTVGKCLLVSDVPEDMYNNQRVANIKVNDNINPKYIHNVIRSNLIQNIINRNKKSSNDNISMDDIRNFVIPLPSKKIQDKIVDKIEELERKTGTIINLIERNSVSVDKILKTFLNTCID